MNRSGLDRNSSVKVLGYYELSNEVPDLEEECTLGESFNLIKNCIKKENLTRNYQFFVTVKDEQKKKFIYRYMQKVITVAGTYDEKTIKELIK